MSPISVPVRRAGSRPRSTVLWIVPALALALCNRPAGAAPDLTQPAAPASGALRVDRDPVTGTLTPAGPTADPMLMPLWSTTMRPALEHLTATRMSDGTLRVDLTGIYLDFATAHREWNGRVTADCDIPWVPGILQPIDAPQTASPALGWADR